MSAVMPPVACMALAEAEPAVSVPAALVVAHHLCGQVAEGTRSPISDTVAPACSTLVATCLEAAAQT